MTHSPGTLTSGQTGAGARAEVPAAYSEDYPLLEWIPELKGIITMENTGLFPTPVEALPFSRNAWIKRDDQSHEEYGGNKIRKLAFIIADAKEKSARRLVTFGAIGTNHGVATAMMCQRAGLECVIYLFDQPVTDTVRKNLRLMQYYGARLVYKGSLFKTVLAFYASPFHLERGSYFLFAGGSNVYGTLAFVNAACEFQNQVLAGHCPEPEIIVCPVGSSATLAGLSYGCQLLGMKTRVMGVRVAPAKLGPFAACTPGTVYGLMKEVHSFLKPYRTDLPVPEQPWLVDSYYGDGYGVATEEGACAIELFGRHGIALEQTYTAKAGAAFLDQLESAAGPVLFWNTYNSSDMSRQADSVRPQQLPVALRKFLI
ncbi:MAG: pyridoxal-phosphate dependent enzyme [Ketobacteraceae bacterium]|nr:pyridoxal-phosphate dependent enzyme [Ketobacteraceae bacterium]